MMKPLVLVRKSIDASKFGFPIWNEIETQHTNVDNGLSEQLTLYLGHTTFLLSLSMKSASLGTVVNQKARPFQGRLGYACLNTILRNQKPPVFCSRTCRLGRFFPTGKRSYVGS